MAPLIILSGFTHCLLISGLVLIALPQTVAHPDHFKVCMCICGVTCKSCTIKKKSRSPSVQGFSP